jgi:hypothetical protein
LIKVEGRKIFPKLTNSILNQEELLEEWKDSIIVPISKKGDRRACSDYRGISYLSITYKMFFNILLPMLSTNAEEPIKDHKCEFRRNMSNTNHIIYIRQILEKKQ